GDWSSDVCSSDLTAGRLLRRGRRGTGPGHLQRTGALRPVSRSEPLLHGRERRNAARAVRDRDGPRLRRPDGERALPDDTPRRRLAASTVLPRRQCGHTRRRRRSLHRRALAGADPAAAARPDGVPEVPVAAGSTGPRRPEGTDLWKDGNGKEQGTETGER